MTVTPRWPRKPSTGSSPDKTVAKPASRLGWLDALRGIAALSVAAYHFSLPLFIPHTVPIVQHADPGIYGVMLFFLVSGYIVPASLERRGDVRAFWIGRAFRIYPVIIVILLASLLILPRAYTVLQGFVFDHPLLTLQANGMLLQDMLAVPNAIGVMWTLTYEMVFYYLVTALFTLGWHKRSSSIAVGCAAVALMLGVAAASPTMISTDLASTRHLATATMLVVGMAMVCIMTGRAELKRLGALLLGGVGLVLLVGNGRATLFETMMIFATMFAGTTIYRAEHGQISRLQALLSCVFVAVAGFAVGEMYNYGPVLWRTWTSSWMGWSLAYVAAWATFGLGFLLRHRKFPRFLSWFGTISFSVYLIHNPLIHAMTWYLDVHHQKIPYSWPGNFYWIGSFTVLLLALSYLTYRLVELPGQLLGRRVVRALARKSASAPTDPGPTAAEPAHPAEHVTEHVTKPRTDGMPSLANQR